jgi:flavin reductase (DIM6/NTAB) family NADH-FMN oxidoreductase RutF
MMDRKMMVIDPRAVERNVFKLIADDWMLVTAGDLSSFNTMTASWGTMGELWNKKVCFCFVRPTRFTYEFLERAQNFTLSFFEEAHRSVLEYCGTVSGRDADKMKHTGLHPVALPAGAVYFSEARLVFECRKIYTHDLDPARFLSPEIAEEYPLKDYHRMYVGEVLTCLAEERTLAG